jgi:pimeloyl-ACP methyl ester carboxylesterase
MTMPRRTKSSLIALAVLALTLMAPSLAAQQALSGTAAIVGHDHFAVREGLRLHLWQKCLAGGEDEAARAGRVLVLVHGATWSGRPDFDLQIRDYSLMDFLARAGYDVWAIDIHGYGQSDRTDADWSDSDSAARDLGAAVEYICSLRSVSRVHILGWSWGTIVGGIYAAARPERVERLILYGTVWKGLPEWRGIPLPTEQYRVNDESGAYEDFIPGQFERDVVAAYAHEAIKADPRSPNGILVDLFSRLPLIDPRAIRVPTLVIRPEYDFASTSAEMSEFFQALGSPDKSLVFLPDGGHNIILEKGHNRFQRVVLDFLERP